MKTLSMILSGAALMFSLHIGKAQGLVRFNNTTSSKVLDFRTDMPVLPNMSLAGLYFSTDLEARPDDLGYGIPIPSASFTLAAVTPISRSANPILYGLYDGGNVALPGVAPGTQVRIMVSAWSSEYAGLQEAMDAFDICIGGTFVDQPVTLGGSTQPVPSLSALVDGFYVCIVPEPSLMGWAGLTLLGWWGWSRRRS